MAITITPAHFMDKFEDLHNWIQNNNWTLVGSSRWNNGNMEIEINEEITPGEIKDKNESELDLPPERYPDSYLYWGMITHNSEKFGYQSLKFDPANISEFFFKYMTMRDNFEVNFKLSKEIGKEVKGICTVKMHDDNMIVKHIISKIYD